ncbi:hypothetical protein ACO0SA_000238 [Hanseniaspora valbyensis]
MGRKDNYGKSERFELVPRPMSDPLYYDDTAPKFVLMPIPVKTKQMKRQQNMDMMIGDILSKEKNTDVEEKDEVPELVSANPYIKKKTNETEAVNEEPPKGSAADYGINFDEKEYNYMQHLKPMGQDPDAVFIPAPEPAISSKKREENLESLFGNLLLKENKNEQPNFQFGRATDQYLEKQVDILDSIKGFKPDMDPRLKEVLTALDDEAYVVNQDVNIDKSVRDKLEKNELDLDVIGDEDEDDFFNQLLQGGEGNGDEEFGGEVDEDNWDLDEFDDQYYDDENFNEEDFQEEEIIKKEIVNNTDPFNIENIAKLNEISWGQDMRTMKKNQKEFGDEENEEDINSMNNFDELEDGDDEEENDAFGELPTFNNTNKTGNNSRKQRRKKGALSDISGFSMSSSAITRTEIMTILDDKFDKVIGGYENYEEDQYDDDYEEFDMSNEREDLDDLLDDFLDNYELSEGGRKLTKKSTTADRIQLAADVASKNNKHSIRRLKEKGLIADDDNQKSKKKSNAW